MVSTRTGVCPGGVNGNKFTQSPYVGPVAAGVGADGPPEPVGGNQLIAVPSDAGLVPGTCQTQALIGSVSRVSPTGSGSSTLSPIDTVTRRW